MGKMHPIRLGLVLALLLGGIHAAWALLVAVGWAQPLIDFIFWLHFINPIYIVAPFKAHVALLLVAITGAIGFLAGASFALLWNRLHR